MLFVVYSSRSTVYKYTAKSGLGEVCEAHLRSLVGRSIVGGCGDDVVRGDDCGGGVLKR